MEKRRRRFWGLSVGSLRRWLIYEPLALLMAILLLPAVGPFQARAQQIPPIIPIQPLQGCPSTNSSIIQNYCFNGTSYYSDLTQLESDAVNAYLGFHGLQASDASIVYQHGQQDLRDAIRAGMYSIMLGIIQKPAAQRSTHEQNLYNWLQSIVQANEINLYTLALADFNSFRNDICHFTLDPDLAKAYNISFDGTVFCFGGLESSIFSPNVPAAAYFRSYGMKYSYAGAALTNPNYASLFADSAISFGEYAGISVGAATLVAAIPAGVLGTSAAAAAAAFVTSSATAAAANLGTAAIGGVGSAAYASGLTISGATASSAFGILLGVVAPVAIIFLAVVIGGINAFELYNNEEQLAEINAMSNTLTQVTGNPPDLPSFVNDTTGLGAYKLENSMYSQMVPDLPATASLPAHGPGDMSFAINPASGPGTITDTLEYLDWSLNVWAIQTSGGWFVRKCTQGPSSTTPCKATTTEVVNGQQTSFTSAEDHSVNADLRYLDWVGNQWIASRNGSVFVITNPNPAPTAQICPIDAVAGVSVPGEGSNPANLSQCAMYTSKSLQMLAQNGIPITVSLTPLAAPTFLSAPPLSFSLGTPATITIDVAGTPTPQVCWQSGLLNDGFSSSVGSCQTGSFQLSFDGLLTNPTGAFDLKLTAANSVSTVTQGFTVNVADNLNILTSGNLTGVAGTPFNLQIIATGNPTPKLSYNGFPLPGLTFVDNGNGSATLSGIFTGSTLIEQCVIGACGGFVATNSQGTVTQPVSLNFTPSPQAFPSPASVTFIGGVYNSAIVSSYGASTQVIWAYFPDPMASWLKYTDNGNGTVTLSGTPPIGNHTFQPSISPDAVGNGCLGCASTFPVNVVATPVFASPNSATFTVGTEGAFSITDNAGPISSSSTLPKGLVFQSGSPALIHGTPAPGSGGQYTVEVTANPGAGGTIVQDLTLNVNQGTSITSPNLVVLYAGQPASFNVETFGYPSNAAQVAPANSGPPSSPSQGYGTYFTTSGLPQTLQASNKNVFGLASGTLAISGTPQAGDVGTHKVQITAQNGVGTPAQQTLTLVVFPSGTVSASVDLVSTFVLSRDANNDVVATVAVANSGTGTAQNVTITSAKIGAVLGTSTPAEVASIGPSSTATFTIVFPAASMGATGTAGVLSLSGNYTGGSFSSGGRLVLP